MRSAIRSAGMSVPRGSIRAVTLTIDTGKALRKGGQLEQLVRAIATADSEDETNWLEWKSRLDLTKNDDRGKLAKGILGFSNRPIDIASRHCEGCGYFIIGADHAGVHGIDKVDLADLEKALTAWLGTGTDAPDWSGKYVTRDGKAVLVILVEPPRAGDRARTLQKAIGNLPAGTIFVRGQAKTEAATPAEIRMLEDRYARSHSDPDMLLDLVATSPADGLRGLADLSDPTAAGVWCAKTRSDLMAQVPSTTSNTPAKPWSDNVVQQLLGASNVMGARAFVDAVEEYLRKCRPRLPAYSIRKLHLSSYNKLSVTVSNPGDHTLIDVRLTVAISAGYADVYDRAPDDSRLPEEPSYKVSAGLAISVSNFAALNPGYLEDLRPANALGIADVSRHGDTYVVVWEFGDLHPGQTETGYSVTLVPRIATGFGAAWSATARNRRGQAGGTFSIGVSTLPPLV